MNIYLLQKHLVNNLNKLLLDKAICNSLMKNIDILFATLNFIT